MFFFVFFLVQSIFFQLTVPTRMTLWFLKPSGNVGKRDPFEDVHMVTEPKTDVLALHHAALSVHHPELKMQMTMNVFWKFVNSE